jgi:hypothetical protein
VAAMLVEDQQQAEKPATAGNAKSTLHRPNALFRAVQVFCRLRAPRTVSSMTC